jgi:predicted metal-dependent HD superfamily phosphohydrolase
MVQQAFITLVVNLTNDRYLAENLWLEIKTAYATADRHFHNLGHLEHLYKELEPLQPELDDWQTVFFSLCYHDVVYDVKQNAVLNDNEERSAAFAEKHLRQMEYPPEAILKCRSQILATQKHSVVDDEDTNYFTDADLSILGQPWPVYEKYKNNIRQEFELYPSSIYNEGRRKVLAYFFNLNPLYKTRYFQHLYEKKAKENISKELEELGHFRGVVIFFKACVSILTP